MLKLELYTKKKNGNRCRFDLGIGRLVCKYEEALMAMGVDVTPRVWQTIEVLSPGVGGLHVPLRRTLSSLESLLAYQWEALCRGLGLVESGYPSL